MRTPDEDLGDEASGFDGGHHPVPVVGFDFDAIEKSLREADQDEAREFQAEILHEALKAEFERGKETGANMVLPHREQIERELLREIFSGRPSGGAALTRAVAAGRRLDVLTDEEAQRLSGSKLRAIQAAGAKMKLHPTNRVERSRNCARK